MRQSNYHSSDILQSVVPTAKAAGLTADVTKGTAIDRQEGESALLELNIGALTTSGTTLDAVWQESDTTTDGDFTDIGIANLQSGALITQKTAASGTDQNQVIKDSYLGTKRYIRCKFTITTAASTGAAVFSANVIMGHLKVSV